MAKEVERTGGQNDPARLRAADADRQQVAERLKHALDEGRLSLHEYDDRVRQVYESTTYADLQPLVADLPMPGMSAADLDSRRRADARREARKMPMALVVLWTIWASLLAVNLVVWLIVAATADSDVYFWPIWLTVPGVALFATTVGVQAARRRDRR
jgi:hypothetical protein